MLAVLKETAAFGFVLKEVPIPSPSSDEVLVKVINASICGTDVGIVDWSEWAKEHVKTPLVIGHELVGRVEKLPDGYRGNLKEGDLVSSETHIFCGECNACKNEKKHICERMELFGISRNGGFAQFATIPIRTTWKNDSSIPLDFMSVQEPFGNAVHAVEEALGCGACHEFPFRHSSQKSDSVLSESFPLVPPTPKNSILILGLGPVGLCAGSVAKCFEVKKIMGVDPSEYRRNLGLKMGFDSVGDGKNLEENSFPVILEMSGHPEGIMLASKLVAPGGKIVAFGLPKKKIEIEWGKFFIDKEVTVKGVFGRKIWDTWEKVTEILKSGKVDLSPLITHRFPLKDFGKAMEIMKSGECGKVIIEVNKNN